MGIMSLFRKVPEDAVPQPEPLDDAHTPVSVANMRAYHAAMKASSQSTTARQPYYKIFKTIREIENDLLNGRTSIWAADEFRADINRLDGMQELAQQAAKGADPAVGLYIFLLVIYGISDSIASATIDSEVAGRLEELDRRIVSAGIAPQDWISIKQGLTAKNDLEYLKSETTQCRQNIERIAAHLGMELDWLSQGTLDWGTLPEDPSGAN